MKVKRRDLSLLKRLFLVDLIRGLKLTFGYQRPSANYTEQYPKERPKIAERFRGAPRLNNDPVTGEETFTENSGVADLGIGLILFRDRLAIQPTVQFPFATDNTDVSYGLVISIGFGIRR